MSGRTNFGIEQRKHYPAITLLALALIPVLLLTGACSGGKKVDIEKLVQIELRGSNGQGRISTSFNQSYIWDFYLDEGDQKPASFSWDNLTKQMEGKASQMRFWDSLKIEAESQDGLSNGDKIRIHVTADQEASKKAKLRLNKSSMVYTVEGLPELKVLSSSELFSYCRLSLEGASPLLQATVNSNLPYDLQDLFNFEYGQNYYKIGDEVIVTLTFSESALEAAGYAVPSGEHKAVFAISAQDVKVHLQELAQMNGAYRQKLFSQVHDIASAWFANPGWVYLNDERVANLSNLQLHSLALLNHKSNTLTGYADESNRTYGPDFISKLVFIYELTCTSYWSADQTIRKAYFCLDSGDLIVHPNGAIEMDLSQVGHLSNPSELLDLETLKNQYLYALQGEYIITEYTPEDYLHQ